MIFETHAHYDDEKFDTDRVELLSSMKEAGIGHVINVGANMKGTRESIHLAHEYDFIFAAAGVHPDDAPQMTEADIEELRKYGADPKVVAIGEIGPDYYWEKDPAIREKQIYWWKRQMDLALELDLPVIIHSRDAAEITMEVMKEYATKGIRAVIHCYSYSAEMAKEFVKLGYYIGVGGVVTFKNGRKLQETVCHIPMDRILLETDSPYMAPEPYRGKRNDSRYIPEMVKKIAEIKGISREEVEDITWNNAFDLFRKAQEWNI